VPRAADGKSGLIPAEKQIALRMPVIGTFWKIDKQNSQQWEAGIA
jgi:hypothetical protein